MWVIRRRTAAASASAAITTAAMIVGIGIVPALAVPAAGAGVTGGAGTAGAAAASGTVRPICGPPYVGNDHRLGPRHLPATGPVGRIVRGYVRFGGISTSRFLYRYWDGSANPAGWRYPPDDGFAHDGGQSNGRPRRARVRLAAGTYIDRFGSEYGSFLSPAGAPFSGRALPPDSLNTRSDDSAHPCNYHLYRVTRAFHVAGGPAEPAFQQPGMRQQYALVSGYIQGAPGSLNVLWLVNRGYLRRAN